MSVEGDPRVDAVAETDEECRAALGAWDEAERTIQGFRYPVRAPDADGFQIAERYVIRDLSKPPADQVIWRGPIGREEDHHAYLVRLGMERMRLALRAARAVPPQSAEAEEIERLRAEVADLKTDVVTFCAPWAVEYAKSHGLPPGHIFASHWDILARAGARMDDFKRWVGKAPDRGV